MTVTEHGKMTTQRAIDQSLRTIGVLFEPGDVIEIRALNVGQTQQRAGCTYSGYFNFENDKAIQAAIRFLDGKADGVYVVLNRLKPELIARSNNRLQARPKHATTDAEILQWQWLYIDIDPIRPA